MQYQICKIYSVSDLPVLARSKLFVAGTHTVCCCWPFCCSPLIKIDVTSLRRYSTNTTSICDSAKLVTLSTVLLEKMYRYYTGIAQ
jgi:hypothetical protein